MPHGFTWLDLLQLGVVTAVLTQLLMFASEHLRGWVADRREARTLALLISASLEKFALECANAIASNDLIRSSGGHAGRRVTKIPDFPDLMPSPAWKVLDPTLATRASNLSFERMLGEGQIDFWWEVTGEPDDITGAADNECGGCGYLAWTTADDLRAHYKIPLIDLAGLLWNFVEELRKHHDYAVKLVAERASEAISGGEPTKVS